MSDIDYYKPDYMKDKKLSDLATDARFVQDAMTFLGSNRRGYTQEELEEMTAEEMASEVNEHFRVQASNEITVAKDVYYINDDSVPEEEKQSFARLMYAFDNAGKTEGLLDNGGEKLLDYAEGIATAPSTVGSVAAGFFSAGAGAAAVQGTKQAALQALKSNAKNIIKRSLVTGAVDGSIAAANDLGLQRTRQTAGETIGEERDINLGRTAVAGAIGGGLGAASYAVPAAIQNKAAYKLVDVVEEGRQKTAAEVADGLAKAEKKIAAGKKDVAKAAKMEEINKRVLRAIDPELVKEGRQAKYDIFGGDLPAGVVGGFDPTAMKRIGAAALDLADGLGVKVEEGQRITEALAKAMRDNGTATNKLLDGITDTYKIDRRQLSAIYAAEVSDAARILRNQKELLLNNGSKVSNKDAVNKMVDDAEELYKQGASTISPEDMQAIQKAKFDLMTPVLRTAKNIETTRRLMMTSQPATTLRNNIFSVAMTGIDTLDNALEGAIKTVKGDFRGGAATFKGSLDTFKYMTGDTYVADALTTVLKQEYPETMSRVFYDAAISEADTVSNSRLTKVGVAFNALNTMSDNVVKRGVIAATINRELRNGAAPEVGKDIMDMLSKGTLNKLPDDILEKALDDSLAFTFQKRFKQDMMQTPEHRMIGKTVKMIHDTGLTVAIPFPRYLASQAKFLSDYSGLTVLRRLGRGTIPTDKELAQTVSGLAVFGSMYSMQKERINDGTWWNERDQWGKNYDIQSALGPTSLMQYVADYAARASEGAPVKSLREVQTDVAKIIGASDFRPGNFQGLEQMQKFAETGDATYFFDTLGNYFASFTYPAAVVKDFYGQADVRSSYVADVSGASQSVLETSVGDIRLSAFQRFFRQIPDFNVEAMVNSTNEMFGTELKAPAVEGLLGFLKDQSKTAFQMDESMNADPAYDAVRYDVFGDGPVRLYNPIMKQITGFIQRPPKNALQRELANMQIDPYKLYRPYSEKNATVSLFQQQLLQGKLAADTENDLLNTQFYKGLQPKEKQIVLKDFLRGYINLTKQRAETLLKDYAIKSEAYQGDYIAYVKGEFRAMPSDQKALGDLKWEQRAEAIGFEGMSVGEALQAIQEKPEDELSAKEKEILATNIRVSYLKESKELDSNVNTLIKSLMEKYQ